MHVYYLSNVRQTYGVGNSALFLYGKKTSINIMYLMTEWNDAGRDYIWQYRGHEPARMTKSHTSSYLTR